MAQIIESIVHQHAEEAAFLWLVRSNAVGMPHYSLPDLAKLDNRVEAHLDGLRIAGEAGWAICKEALGLEAPGEAFAAAVWAFESGDACRIKEVLDAGLFSEELSHGIISALGWLPFDQVQSHVASMGGGEKTFQKRIGLAGYAVHRQDPGSALKEALASSDKLLKARALKAVGELGRKDLLPLTKENICEKDSPCRFWTAWSGALLGERAVIPVLQRIAESSEAHAERACTMALRLMSGQEAHAWQQSLASQAQTLRMAVQAAGVMGDPVVIPWLIQQMTVPALARVAGESFTYITGVDLAYEDLEGEKPEGFEAGPTENPEDENVDMDADENLPWPNAGLIEQWWDKNRSRFTNGTRYLCGQPMTIESLNEVLRTGRQRQRAAAAIELVIRKPGEPLFEVRAPGFRQQQQLLRQMEG